MGNSIKATNTLNSMRNASTNGLATITINANQMGYNDSTSNMLLYSNGIKSAAGNNHLLKESELLSSLNLV